jgi:uncharacterized membrane protein
MMQAVIEYLKLWQPHPFVDHFTVALILLGIVTDLVGSLFSTRLWLRYMALTLMILGAIGAALSNITGGWEADRVWNLVSGPGKDVLKRHAWWGDILPWVFAALALWRLGVQFLGFLAATRPIYLLAAIVSGVLIIYQGHLGGVMVYDYGIGTAAFAGGQTTPRPPAASPGVPSAEVTSSPLVPATPLGSPSPTPSITEGATPFPRASGLATPATTPTVPGSSSTAAPPPSGTGNPQVSPSPSESPSPGEGAAKNL